jgi:hypothetical protein
VWRVHLMDEQLVWQKNGNSNDKNNNNKTWKLKRRTIKAPTRRIVNNNIPRIRLTVVRGEEQSISATWKLYGDFGVKQIKLPAPTFANAYPNQYIIVFKTRDVRFVADIYTMLTTIFQINKTHCGNLSLVFVEKCQDN